LSVGQGPASISFAGLGFAAIVIAALAPRLTGRLRVGPSGVELNFIGVVANPESSRFLERIAGLWWDIIDSRDTAKSAVSLCRIYLDNSTITLMGTGYREDGNKSASWDSQMVRFVPSQFKLTYLWTGHWEGKKEDADFHGLGILRFDPPEGSSSICTRAEGHFWHVDEEIPANTLRHKVRFRRVDEGSGVEAKMKDGTVEYRAAEVDRVLKKWPHQ